MMGQLTPEEVRLVARWATSSNDDPVLQELEHEKTIGSKGKGLWGMKGEQLPALIQRVYNDLVESGKHPTGSMTYRLAVGIVQNWARGSDGKTGKVSAKTQAKAVKAIAEWEKLRAKARADNVKEGSINLVGRIAEDFFNVKPHARKAKSGKISMVKGYRVKHTYDVGRFTVGAKHDGGGFTDGPEGIQHHDSEEAALRYAQRKMLSGSTVGSPPKSAKIGNFDYLGTEKRGIGVVKTSPADDAKKTYEHHLGWIKKLEDGRQYHGTVGATESVVRQGSQFHLVDTKGLLEAIHRDGLDTKAAVEKATVAKGRSPEEIAHAMVDREYRKKR